MSKSLLHFVHHIQSEDAKKTAQYGAVAENCNRLLNLKIVSENRFSPIWLRKSWKMRVNPHIPYWKSEIDKTLIGEVRDQPVITMSKADRSSKSPCSPNWTSIKLVNASNKINTSPTTCARVKYFIFLGNVWDDRFLKRKKFQRDKAHLVLPIMNNSSVFWCKRLQNN